MVRGQRCDSRCSRSGSACRTRRSHTAGYQLHPRSIRKPATPCADASLTRSQTPAAGTVPRPRRSISHCRAAAKQPSKRLVGFQKVDLAPGTSEQVTVIIDSSASNHPLSYWVPENNAPVPGWSTGRRGNRAAWRLHGPRRDLLGEHAALVQTIPLSSPPLLRLRLLRRRAARRCSPALTGCA